MASRERDIIRTNNKHQAAPARYDLVRGREVSFRTGAEEQKRQNMKRTRTSSATPTRGKRGLPLITVFMFLATISLWLEMQTSFSSSLGCSTMLCVHSAAEITNECPQTGDCWKHDRVYFLKLLRSETGLSVDMWLGKRLTQSVFKTAWGPSVPITFGTNLSSSVPNY